jgi:hypothetical protein
MNSFSQPYKTGLGLRLGSISSGLTIKHFVSSNSAIEGIASFGRHSFLVTGLYERHHIFPTEERLAWFYGGGIHFGFFSKEHGYHYFYYKSHNKKIYEAYPNNPHNSFGADLILGLEYKFRNVPISLTLDAKPFFDLAPGVYSYWEGAFTFRFTL